MKWFKYCAFLLFFSVLASCQSQQKLTEKVPYFTSGRIDKISNSGYYFYKRVQFPFFYFVLGRNMMLEFKKGVDILSDIGGIHTIGEARQLFSNVSILSIYGDWRPFKLKKPCCVQPTPLPCVILMRFLFTLEVQKIATL